MRRTPSNYNATVHTLEIQPIFKPEWDEPEAKKQWWRELYQRNLDYIGRKWTASDGQPRIILNPHKLHHGPSGKWVFEYRSAIEIQADLEQICGEMQIDGYILKRLDICLDTDLPYNETEKIIRLIVLMLGTDFGAANRYIGVDPLTLQTKSLTLANSTKPNKTVEVEHYNRSLLSQDEWENQPITNRLELRMLRQRIDAADTIQSIAGKWLSLLSSLTERQMKQVVDVMTLSVFRQWKNHCDLFGRPTGFMRNSFYVLQAGNIFTREQLKHLYELELGDKGAAKVNNMLKASRQGCAFELYTFKDVRLEINALIAALERFMQI